MNNLEVALEAIKKASVRLNELLKKEIVITSAINKDIKLEADKESENIITGFIRENSDYPILSEEFVEKMDYRKGEYIWIVDPLDGSLNFSRGIPFYCISIGLWKKGEPVLGVIYDLVAGKTYWGEIEKGAFCEGNKIFTSKTEKRKNAIISTGFPVYSEFDNESLTGFVNKIQEYKKVRLFGSAAFSITLVASGAIDAYSEDNIAIWDVAGALAILKTAGGNYELSEGRDYNLVNILATNGKLEK